MNINYVNTWILGLFFLQIYLAGEMRYAKYVKHLVNSIKQDSRRYQVTIISNNQKRNPENEDIINQILSETPGLVIDLEDPGTEEKFIPLSVFDEPRVTNFITIEDSLRTNGKELDLKKTLDFLNKLSPRRIRPKFLIISLTTRKSYENEKILRQMWSKQYLDVTILQLAEQKASKNTSQNHHQVEATIHQLNPFTNVCEKLKFSRKIQWFPDKLRDMKGFTLNASLTYVAPYSIVRFNESGHLVHFSGADISTFEALAKKINFSTSIITSVGAKEGIYNLKRKSATGMVGMLLNHEINTMITTYVKIIPGKQSLTEYTRMIHSESLYALVPILPGPDVILNPGGLYMTLITILVIITLIYLVPRLLKFAEIYWQPIDILSLLLGMGVPQQPTTLPERIFFTSVIVVAFCYASEIFAGITSINLKVATEMEFNTFEDLDSSGLTLILHPNLFNATFSDSEGVFLNLKKKCLKLQRCPVQSLVKEKNISCLTTSSIAAATINSTRNKSGRPTMKIMKQPFWSSGSVMHLEKRSPYVERFNEILIRLSESGVRKKWSGKYSDDFLLSVLNKKNREISDFENVGGVTNLRRRFIFIALHGYSLAIIVFIGEILFNLCCRVIRLRGH